MQGRIAVLPVNGQRGGAGGADGAKPEAETYRLRQQRAGAGHGNRPVRAGEQIRVDMLEGDAADADLAVIDLGVQRGEPGRRGDGRRSARQRPGEGDDGRLQGEAAGREVPAQQRIHRDFQGEGFGGDGLLVRAGNCDALGDQLGFGE